MKTLVGPMTHWRMGCWWTVFLAVTTPSAVILAQAQTTPAAVPLESEVFPDGVTPSHVFARLELLDRCLDRLLDRRDIPHPKPAKNMESGLGSLHVYQLVLACSQRVTELNDQARVLAMPTLSARPRDYYPRDGLYVTGLILDGVKRATAKFEIKDLPTDEIMVAGKTPTDVFGLASLVFSKLNALCGYEDMSPQDVYAEMVRAIDDVVSILRQADPEERYRIDAPLTSPEIQPIDVYKKCLSIRRVINEHRIAFGALATQVPDDPENDTSFAPRDVFFQTQIILAELNYLKILTGTKSSTPLPIPVRSSKEHSDVHQQANLLEFLLLQIRSGANTSVEASQQRRPDGANR